MKIRKISNTPNYVHILEYASDNRGSMRVMDEATLNRIVKKHDADGYIIISACRGRFYKNGEEVPRDIDATPDELLSGEKLDAINNARTIQLKKDIISANYSFLPVYGGFKEEGSDEASFEKSFIVFNFNRKGEKQDMNKLVDLGLKLGQKYNQDCILVKKPDSNPYYALTSGNDIGAVDMEFDGNYTLNDLTQMYFTALKKIKNDGELKDGDLPQRFTFEGLYLNPSPNSVHEATYRHYHNELF